MHRIQFCKITTEHTCTNYYYEILKTESLRGYLSLALCTFGDHGGTAVKVLCNISEGRWFDPSWCQWNFTLT